MVRSGRRLSKRRLTAKRMTDKRFRRTEKLILEVFSKGSGGTNSKNSNINLRTTNLSVKKMMKKIGRSRATFYLHHGRVFEVVGDFEEYILGEYKRETKRFKNGSTKEMIYGSLVFVIKNRDIFWMLAKRGEGRIFERMAEEILQDFQEMLSETALVILEGEVVAVFKNWSRAGFPEKKIKKVARDAASLIETSKRRLEEIK